MSKRIVLVDICNTLADVNSEIERMTGVARIAGQYCHPSVSSQWFLEHMEVFANASVIKGALGYINQLEKQYELIYLTARPKETESITKDWLSTNGFPAAPVIFTGNKVAYAHDLDIAFAIDDAPEEIEQYEKAGIYTQVPAWDYNLGYVNRIVYAEGGRAICQSS